MMFVFQLKAIFNNEIVNFMNLGSSYVKVPICMVLVAFPSVVAMKLSFDKEGGSFFLLTGFVVAAT